jgi:hypothetical protein
MKIEGTGLEGKQLTLLDLDHVMEQVGFVRWAWDYKRATYDYKYEDKKSGETFYLRVPAIALKGEIQDEGNESILEVGEPYIGRHTYPHGMDYEYNFPSTILDNAKRKLTSLSQLI